MYRLGRSYIVQESFVYRLAPNSILLVYFNRFITFRYFSELSIHADDKEIFGILSCGEWRSMTWTGGHDGHANVYQVLPEYRRRSRRRWSYHVSPQ